MNRKEERTGEKSNFSITCSLLSQYLKKKGSFGKLGLEMAAPRPLDQQLVKGKLRAPPATMTLLPGAYVSDEDERAEDGAADGGALKSMELFPQHAGFGSPINTLPPEEEPREASDTKEVERAQLTIFYGGKVLVFDNFPSDKAMDLMQSCGVSATPPAPAPAPAPVTVPAVPVPAVPENSSGPALFAPASTSQTPPESGQQLAKSAEASASDMPIARRNSLHRFLEKRKDRIITKAPYEVHGGSPARPAESKPESSKGWPADGKPESSKGNWPAEAKPESSKGNWLAEATPESSKGWLELGRQDSKPETSSGRSR